MPFRVYIPIIKKEMKERRWIRAMNNRKLPLKYIYDSQTERASVSTSVKGSITVEAAMAVPLFFFAVLCLFYLMEIMSIQTAVRSGLQNAGKILAEQGYDQKVLSPMKVENDVISSIGAERLQRSIVEGGSGGIDCSQSSMSGRTGIAQLKAVYKIRIPVPIFAVPLVTYEESLKVKTWCGYEKAGLGNQESETVYITETGVVYHKDYNCTYLKLSIHMVSTSEIEHLRNENGGKYHPCEHCGKTSGGGVYITNHGDRYHSSLSCSGLKRTVYAVPISEAVGKGACSKCGQ